MRLLTPNMISMNITDTIILHNPDLIKKKDEIRYGLEWMISGMNQLILTLAAAIPFGIVTEAFLILFSGAALRMFSGGGHATSYYKCLFISLSQVIALALVIKHTTVLHHYPAVIIILLICSLFILYVKAPVLHKKKHLFNTKEKRRLKYLSLLTFGFLFAVGYMPYLSDFKHYIWLSLIIQSFTLTNSWEKILSYGENFIYK
jgi:accessory gene regulator B